MPGTWAEGTDPVCETVESGKPKEDCIRRDRDSETGRSIAVPGEICQRAVWDGTMRSRGVARSESPTSTDVR